MSLNTFGAVVGIMALIAILVLYGHEKAKVIASHEQPRVTAPVRTPVPLPAPKPSHCLIGFRCNLAPAPKVAPTQAAPKAPVSKPLNISPTDFCTQVKLVASEHGKAWTLARAKQLGYTAQQTAAVEKCMN